MPQRQELIIRGRVQGVGFRPFVYRLAQHYKLSGWVRNERGSVRIQIQGPAPALDEFVRQLLNQAPLTSRPQLDAQTPMDAIAETGFAILPSSADQPADIHVPPDYFTCPDCLGELGNPSDRRYQYPFNNCTACGPRYTIIRQLPYDRASTTLAGFTLCPACQAEYSDPLNRRFHAEPLACPQCGPQLEYRSVQGVQHARQDALNAAVAALAAGELVLIKGIGGYHLCCDAGNADAIARLRQRKPRPDKPLALMFAAQGDDELDAVRACVVVDDLAAALLRSPARPIVLLPRHRDCPLPDNIAPHMQELGVMLPYSPLHHLLLAQLARPLVATSANLSGEPVLTDNAEVDTRLGHLFAHVLHHNRPIQRPADDPVLRISAGRARPLRLGRGMAPLELTLPQALARPLLAVGGHMKNTIALAWQQRVVLSPHIGDLDSPRSRRIFEQVIADFQQLYDCQAQQLVCDQHPGYASRRWAETQDLPLLTIPHHHAHASAVAGEYPAQSRWLVFTWDGVGLGEDGTLWGGEALLGRPGAWRRVASWRPFRLPGGEQAARAPWRTALGLCWEAQLDWHAPADQDASQLALLQQAWQRGLNAPGTSAVGRLFDAAAALLGICQQASFEGQGPMWLEQQAQAGPLAALELPVYRDSEGLLRTDWAPLLPMLLDENHSQAARAYSFHASLAGALVNQARHLRDQHGEFALGLGGGVFQNRLLCELVIEQAQAEGFRVYLPEQLPVNDGGLCYGQVIEAAARLA